MEQHTKEAKNKKIYVKMNELNGKKSVGSSSSLGQFLTGASRQPTSKDLKQNKHSLTYAKDQNSS